MSKETGGTAFASQLEVNRDGYAVTGGMTLRDYFAAKAMQAEISRSGYSGREYMIDDANTAYRMADAMLKARK